jgi:hypothetical protein
MRVPILGAKAQSNEPTVKRDNETIKIDFRPKISLALPATGIAAVPTSWFTLKTHPAKIREVLNEVIIIGKATLTELPLIEPRSRAMLISPKTRYLVITNYAFRLLNCLRYSARLINSI